MTASIRTSVSSEKPSRTILGWLDDQVERTMPTDDEVEYFSSVTPPFGAEEEFMESASDLLAHPVAHTTLPVELARVWAPLAAEGVDARHVRNTIFHGSPDGLWANQLGANGVKTFCTTTATPSSLSAAPGVQPDWAFLAPVIAGLSRHCDFYSSVLPELAQIEMTIGSISEMIRESVQRLVGGYTGALDHANYFVAEDDLESTGLAYTDRLGDYPPLERVWEDVEVVIGNEDEIEQRVFGDEDHQVWRI